MSDNWYFVSFNFKSEKDPPTDAWEFLQWLCHGDIVFDNIRLVKPKESRVVEMGDTDG